LSGVLDVEDPIPGRYQLEVSSPGMDRPLFTLEHFERFKGELVRLQLSRPLEGRRRFKALIEGIDGHDLILVEDGLTFRVPFDMIEKARLSPQFDN
jgi:ribosome maturation factor RimP